MAQVDQQGQPGTSSEFEREGVESIKIERNTKGVNFSYRVVRKEGQSWDDVLETLDDLHRQLTRRFGN